MKISEERLDARSNSDDVGPHGCLKYVFLALGRRQERVHQAGWGAIVDDKAQQELLRIAAMELPLLENIRSLHSCHVNRVLLGVSSETSVCRE
jgi:hypothetical protein